SRRRSLRPARRAPCRPRPRARSRTRPGPGSRERPRRSRASPSQERVDVEGRLLVRVSVVESRDHLVVARGREDRLEPELRHALLAAGLADRRRGAFPAEEGAGPLRVPGAALVVADPAGSGLEERRAHPVERLGRNEDDELPLLAVHVWPAAGPGTARPWPRSKSCPGRPRPSARTPRSRSRWTRR